MDGSGDSSPSLAERRASLESAEQTQGGDERPPPREVVLAPGERFDRYVLLHRIGAGGMGTVYAAYDPRLDRRVALKVIHRAVSQKSGVTLRAQSVREAQALAKLSHPNVVTVHDVDESDGQLYIAMEYIDGKTLEHWARVADRDKDEVLRVLIDVGRGLAAVHDAGLIHRDLKPSNVMVGGGKGAPWLGKVMDFGLARGVGGKGSGSPRDGSASSAEGDGAADSTKGSWGRIVGTPAYMSPEQHLGLEAGEQSDQFSFCVTAYEALYGTRPYDTSTSAALAAAVVGGEVREPPSTSTVSPHVWPVLRRGLRPAPEERWPSMRALLVALEPPRERAAARRWPWIAAGAIAVGGVAAAAWVRTGAPEDRCSEAVRPLEESWSPATRSALLAHLEQNLQGERSPDAIVQRLDRFADQWRQRRVTSCLAADGSAEVARDAVLLSQCLDLRLVEFDAWIEVLHSTDAEQTRVAATGVEAMRGPRRCDDVADLRRELKVTVPTASLGQVARVREDLARGRVYQDAGRFDESLRLATRALADTEGLDVPILRAEARLVLGNLRQRRQEFEQAAVELQHAFTVGVREGDDRLTLEAALSMTRLLNETMAPLTAIDAWAMQALALVEKRRDVETESNAYEVLGIAYSERDPERSREYFAQALEAAEEAYGPRSRAVATTLLNDGVAHLRWEEAGEAVPRFERALAIIEELEGADANIAVHARREHAAAVLAAGDAQRALQLARANLDRIARGMGTRSQQYGQQLELMASIHCALGELEHCAERAAEAVDAYEQVLGRDALFLVGPLTKRAEALSMLDRNDEARRIARRGKELAERHGLPEVAARFDGLLGQPPGESSAAEALGELGDREVTQREQDRQPRDAGEQDGDRRASDRRPDSR